METRSAFTAIGRFDEFYDARLARANLAAENAVVKALYLSYCGVPSSATWLNLAFIASMLGLYFFRAYKGEVVELSVGRELTWPFLLLIPAVCMGISESFFSAFSVTDVLCLKQKGYTSMWVAGSYFGVFLAIFALIQKISRWIK